MILGLDTFSFRSQGWDAFRTLDEAASLGLGNVQFSERAHLGSFDPEHLRAVRDHAGRLGLTLEIGMRSIDRHAASFDPALGSPVAQFTDMLHAAGTIGSPIVRCFFGMASDRLLDIPVASRVAEVVATLREVTPLAARLGIRIAIENHGMGDLLAPELRDVIEAVGSPHVGVCFDSGNPAYAAEDPVFAAEVLAPYVITSHIRDTRVWRTERGAVAQWVPVGEGNVDLRRVLAILGEANPDLAVNLEIITGGAPYEIPFLDPSAEFWRLFPEMSARSLARFVALADMGSESPFPQHLGATADDETMRLQQRQHFEASVIAARRLVIDGSGATSA